MQIFTRIPNLVLTQKSKKHQGVFCPIHCRIVMMAKTAFVTLAFMQLFLYRAVEYVAMPTLFMVNITLEIYTINSNRFEWGADNDYSKQNVVGI